MMGEIYAQAQEVIVWLGNASNVEIDGLRILKDERWWDQDSDTPTAYQQRVVFEHFFRKPYWSRIWIVQEIILAEELVLYFGGFRLPWASVRSHDGALQEPDAGSSSHYFAVLLE